MSRSRNCRQNQSRDWEKHVILSLSSLIYDYLTHEGKLHHFAFHLKPNERMFVPSWVRNSVIQISFLASAEEDNKNTLPLHCDSIQLLNRFDYRGACIQTTKKWKAVLTSHEFHNTTHATYLDSPHTCLLSTLHSFVYLPYTSTHLYAVSRYSCAIQVPYLMHLVTSSTFPILELTTTSTSASVPSFLRSYEEMLPLYDEETRLQTIWEKSASISSPKISKAASLTDTCASTAPSTATRMISWLSRMGRQARFVLFRYWTNTVPD